MPGHLHEHLQERGHVHGVGDAVLGDQVDDPHRVDLALAARSGARSRSATSAQKPPATWNCGITAMLTEVSSKSTTAAGRRQRREAGAVAEHHALRQPGGARRVVLERDVVRAGRHARVDGVAGCRPSPRRPACRSWFPITRISSVLARSDSKPVEQGHEVLAHHQHLGRRVVDDERRLGRGQAPVHRHEDGVELGRAEHAGRSTRGSSCRGSPRGRRPRRRRPAGPGRRGSTARRAPRRRRPAGRRAGRRARRAWRRRAPRGRMSATLLSSVPSVRHPATLGAGQRTVERGEPADVGGRQPLEAEHPVAREAAEQLLQRHPGLEPGQRGAEAEVDPVAEGEVALVGAVDVEPVGVDERPVVAVGRRVVHLDAGALRDPDAADLDVSGGGAGEPDHRRLEAQHLLDGRGDQRRVGHEAGPDRPGAGRAARRRCPGGSSWSRTRPPAARA